MPRIVVPVLLVLLSLAVVPAETAPGGQFVVPRAEIDIFPIGEDENAGPLLSCEGEVLAARVGQCRLRPVGTGRELTFCVNASCLIFANAVPACLEAIRPVAPGAFFWARVWWDHHRRPRLIEAVYCGGELTMLSASRAWLTGISPETRAIVTLPVSSYRLVAHLLPGQSIYVLLDLEGRVRWVRELRS